MAVVGYRRVADGSGLAGRVGESLRVTERWEIRVDSPLTSKLEIAQAVPVGWFTAHWDFPECRAMEFNLTARGRDGMIWAVEVVFYVPPEDKKLDAEGVPEDYWEASGGTSTVPLFEDVYGDMIVNAAGDPLEGLEREREEISWTLTKHYTDNSWELDRFFFAGHVNSSDWAGGLAKTWKCYFKSATKREIQNIGLNKAADDAGSGSGSGVDDPDDGNRIEYVETKWEFRFEPETWKALPWDVGFMELDGSGNKRSIVGDDGKAVKQPVALNSDGSAKDAGDPPTVINNGDGADIYPTADFSGWVGEPSIIAGS